MSPALRRLAGALVLAAPLGAQDPVGVVELELVGPAEVTGFSAGFERTDVRFGLGAGESRRLLAPFLSRRRRGAEAALPRLVEEEDATGTRLLPETLRRPDEWNDLPISLKSRGLPALGSERPAVGALHLAWMLAAALVVLGLRRRPWLAASLGGAAGLAVFWLPAPLPGHPVVQVLEGDGQSGRWLRVHGARERLELGQASVGWVRHLPQAGERWLEVREVDQAASWSICSPGSRIYFMQEIPGPRTPSRRDPAGQAFEEVWLREAGRGWSPRGSWSGGQDLPAEVVGAPGPPGWLVAGLPQGVTILAGRLSAAGEQGRWLRLVGFQ